MPQKSRRRSRLTAVLVVGALTLAGCGGSGSASNGARPTTTDPSPATTARPLGDTDTDAGAKPVDALGIDGPTVVADVADVAAPPNPSTPKLPATVTDARGSEVTITSAERIIALDLYATLSDTVIGLGLADRVVGRAASDTQRVLQDRPVVSRDGLELNTEAVLGLHPDLVLTNLTIGSERVYTQLEAAGITVVRFPEVPSIADIGRSIDDVGAVFGLGDAAESLASRTETDLRAARVTIAALRRATPRPPRAIVLYVRGNSNLFFIFGPDYGAAQVLDELGLKDVAGDSGITDLAPANAESLVSLDPEIILTMKDGVDSTGGIDGLLARPGIAQTTAGRNKRLVLADDNQLLSYGPRTPANLVALAQAIYTDAADG